MSVKGYIHTFQKMNKDLTESKSPVQFYYDAHNIRFITDKEVTTGAFEFEKGNELVFTLPVPVINSTTKTIDYIDSITGNKSLSYKTGLSSTQPRNELEQDYYISTNVYRTSNKQIIIGHCIIRDNIILFSTDNSGFDCVWKINDETYEITLLYMRDLGFNSLYPVQAINNYENELIDKIYWVDGKNQMRFVNIHHSIENQDLENLIDLSFNNIQMVGTFELDQPKIIDSTTGGIHTAGMIQYAYNLYRINGSQTQISPLSELVALDKGNGNGGGEVNEIVGTIPIIKINDLDNTYTHLKLYAIKYTSYNQTPSISLILDRSIATVNEITYYDDGNIIEELSIEEFLFLGSNLIIPSHINSKVNRLFFAKYKEKNFDINTYGELISIDTRAYSFPVNSTTTKIYNSLYENNTGVVDSTEPFILVDTNTIIGTTSIPYQHSTININYDLNNRQFNSTIIGGEGSYIKYRIIRNEIGVNGFTEEDAKGKFLKDNEIYRLGIQFYNKYGQVSLPKWIADFKNVVANNESNLNQYYASLEVTLKPLFYTWLADNNNFLDDNGIFDDSLKPVGYRLLRSERTLLDRTILCQGLINGMLSQVIGDSTGANYPDNYIEKVNNGVKIPSMMRRFDQYLAPMWGNLSYWRLDRFDEYHPHFDPGPGPAFTNDDAGNEVFKAEESGQWTAGTYQFNKLMQMFSPEITFNLIQNLSQVRLNIIGALENSDNSSWHQVRNIENKLIIHEGRVFNAIYPHDTKAYIPGNYIDVTGSRREIQNHGFFGHVDEGSMNFVQTYRQYTGNFYPGNPQEKIIYGIPEIVEKGQGRTTYNNDGELVYYNSLEPLAADIVLDNVNSWGAKNVTFALGANGIATEDRLSIENLKTASGIEHSGIGLVAEFRIPHNLVYLGNIYGGNTYESKKRTNYVEIGEYNNINTNIYEAIHAGDTFVNNFRFTKLAKTDTEVYTWHSEQLTEIVEFRVETTVDLLNRNDQSLQQWDNRFQPKYDDYQKYNKVYSQDSNLIIRRDLDYRFKKATLFDTNVIASKIKIPGEIIDSWTDLQENEVITLDGKNGPINNLISYKDELFTFQDKGVAALSIQPRVQVQGSDGIGVELGTGQVLAEYKYITTSSGSINKWGILSVETGIYYLDALNKTFNVIGESGFKGLSDSEGFHKYFLDNLDLSVIKVDNPIIQKGVSLGWDKVTNYIYLTVFNDSPQTFTLSYNLAQQGFSSFYDYNSSIYIFTRGKLLTINPNLEINQPQIYETHKGKYNKFYNENKPSSMEFIVNPEPNVECTFNNLEYKSEAFNATNDEVNYTWETIKAYNEFQNSNDISLIPGNNIRKLNRKWRLIIPRDKNKINRIRNTWSIIKLSSLNPNNFRYRNQDIIIYYNPTNKTFS